MNEKIVMSSEDMALAVMSTATVEFLPRAYRLVRHNRPMELEGDSFLSSWKMRSVDGDDDGIVILSVTPVSPQVARLKSVTYTPDSCRAYVERVKDRWPVVLESIERDFDFMCRPDL